MATNTELDMLLSIDDVLDRIDFLDAWQDAEARAAKAAQAK